MQKTILVLLLLSGLSGPAIAQVRSDNWLEQLLLANGSAKLKEVLANRDSFQYQVIYTRIDRNPEGYPIFTNFHLNVDRDRYFNPASTVKLPVALAALEKINRLRQWGIDRTTPMLTDSAFSGQTAVHSDTSSANGLPSVEHYIKKIFLVSDNDAYNRLYELVGQNELNEMLRQKGYPGARIIRRFVPMTEEENRHTNPVRFVKNGKLLYNNKAQYNSRPFHFPRKILIGRAYYDRNDSLIHQPMDFTAHNNLPLQDLQQMLQSVIYPESVPAQKRFLLTPDDLQFLRRYMSAYPSESTKPTYDTSEFFNSYTKFFFKGGRRTPPPHLRIFNKTGWSYGFLTDASYVIDTLHNIEFMLCAAIYVNADGVLNDNKYEYEETGYPFFAGLFEVIYEYEKRRRRD